jgi:hypothetical protein
VDVTAQSSQCQQQVVCEKLFPSCCWFSNIAYHNSFWLLRAGLEFQVLLTSA